MTKLALLCRKSRELHILMWMRICRRSLHLLSQTAGLLYPDDKAHTFVLQTTGAPHTYVDAYMLTQLALALASHGSTIPWCQSVRLCITSHGRLHLLMLLRLCCNSLHLPSQATGLLYPDDKACACVSQGTGGPPTNVGAYMPTQLALAIASHGPTIP